MTAQRRTLVVVCHCGSRHVLDVGAYRDPRGELVDLASGWQGRCAATLRRWARAGRLVAYRAERGALVAWEADLRAAVECKPVKVECALDDEDDAIPVGLRRGQL